MSAELVSFALPDNAGGATLLQRSHKLNQSLGDEVVAQIARSPASAKCFLVSSYVCAVASLLVAGILYGLLRWLPPTDLAGAEEKSSAGTRNAHLDNAKFLGMVLVCWSHVGGSVKSKDVIWFHMPLFIFLSGSFVRPFSPQVFLKLVVTLVMPLFFFVTIIFPLLEVLSLDRSPQVGRFLWLHTEPGNEGSLWHLLTGSGPGYFIWFLRCLIIFRMVTMFTVMWPKALQVAMGLACGVLGVYLPPASPNPKSWEMGPFAYQRAMCVFPIFLMGQHMDLRGLLQATADPSSSRVFLFWVVLMSLLFLENKPALWDTVTFGAFDVLETTPAPFLPYKHDASCPRDFDFLWARYFASLAYRTSCMLLFLLFGVPRGKTWFTEAGSMTLYAYLLHFPFVRWAAYALPWIAKLHVPMSELPLLIQYVCFMAFAFFLNLYFVGIVYALTTRPVRALFGVLIEPTCLLRLATSGSDTPQGSKKEAD